MLQGIGGLIARVRDITVLSLATWTSAHWPRSLWLQSASNPKKQQSGSTLS